MPNSQPNWSKNADFLLVAHFGASVIFLDQSLGKNILGSKHGQKYFKISKIFLDYYHKERFEGIQLSYDCEIPIKY